MFINANDINQIPFEFGGLLAYDQRPVMEFNLLGSLMRFGSPFLGWLFPLCCLMKLETFSQGEFYERHRS
jgi:hypothetical protein